MRTLVSIDLDDVGCYHAIHGLQAPCAEMAGIVLERCLPRFLELFAALGVRATFFVIGRDLERDQHATGRGAQLLRQAAAEGHELANHSYAHAYDLVRWSSTQIREDLTRCDRLLGELGIRPQGFRAPGYTHDAALLTEVAALGYTYDSSALPSVPYYLAKAAVIAWLALRGRRSQSMLRGARSFVGEALPRLCTGLADGHRLVQLPISVSPRLRIPLIGTSLLSGPVRFAAALRRRASSLEYFHLEMHGIDLSDPHTDGYAPQLIARQPELRVPLRDKLSRLRELLGARGPTTLLRDLASAELTR